MDAKGVFESIDAKGLLIHRFDMYRCTDNYGKKKIDEIFSFFCDITHENNNSDYEDEIFVPSSPSKEQEIYHHNYIEDPEGENDLTPPRPKSEIPVVNSWDSFEIDDIDIIKIFNSLRNSNLPRKNPEVQQSAILGILGLTRQHKLTKNKLITIWSDLLNDFQLDVVWNMIELDRSEIEFFDNIEQTLPILY
ncbi:hypothetical protein RhiirA4_461027 [Rhizophagus irregularis]|uniref:Uncharacterized protein n=1 Tax=Rhizophagus irregularis TaxID=588596 RepID=A0A2I1GHW9_9GLOM|nr:hypothetical protein RhiirA4_461027 [Rhizophagus irregularis]